VAVGAQPLAAAAGREQDDAVREKEDEGLADQGAKERGLFEQ